MALVFSIDDGAISLVGYGEVGKPMGTCFAMLRPTWLVTAKHVAMRDGLPRTDLLVSPYKQPSVRARILFAHPEVDIAVLEVERPICRRPLFPAHHSMSSADGLIVAGYTPSMSVVNGAPTILVNSVAKYDIEMRERAGFVEEVVVFEAAQSEGGNSGGPLLGTAGALVGVVIENFAQDGRVYARGTSLDPLLSCLNFPS